MRLLPFAATGLLVLTLSAAFAQEPKPGMGATNGMVGMGMPGMGGHMHHPVQSPQGAGAAAQGADPRQALELTEGERNFVLAEMRTFLESVTGIVEAVAEGKPKTAADAARRSGMQVMQEVPPSLMGKLPMEFRQLGMDTHKRFSALADEASGMGDEKQIMKQLATLLANCNACHQGYRIAVK